MKKMKRAGALLLTTAMAASMTVPALAATTYTYIDELNIDISYSIEAGSDEWDLNVSCSDKGIIFDDYDNVKVTNAPDDGEAWDENVKPKVQITIKADRDDDFKFDTSAIKKETVHVNVEGLEEDDFKYSISDSTTSVTVTVTLPKLQFEEGYWEELLELDDLEWGDYDGTVRWTENENADYYEMKLYRGTSALTGIVKTEYTEADLSQYFTRQGDYTVKVRAVKGKETGEWVEEDLSVDTDEAREIRANGGELETGNVNNSGSSSSTTNKNNTTTSTTNKNNTTSSNNTAGPGANNTSSVKLPDYVVDGTWTVNNGNWMFKDKSGTAYKSRWAAVYNPYANTALGQQNFDWFYFNEKGIMMTGWVQDGGRWYYLSPVSDGTLGRMVTGWAQIGNNWYYFNPVSDGTRGAMLTNTWIGQNYVGADGKFDPNKVK